MTTWSKKLNGPRYDAVADYRLTRPRQFEFLDWKINKSRLESKRALKSLGNIAFTDVAIWGKRIAAIVSNCARLSDTYSGSYICIIEGSYKHSQLTTQNLLKANDKKKHQEIILDAFLKFSILFLIIFRKFETYS